MFALDKDAGWKERGAGMLKLNVPVPCLDYDDNDVAIPGSFDASGLEDDEAGSNKIVRLIMRQDQTHRVILNTALLPAMTFTEKSSLKSVGVMFHAFEGATATPVAVTMRVSLP